MAEEDAIDQVIDSVCPTDDNMCQLDVALMLQKELCNHILEDIYDIDIQEENEYE